MVVAEWTGAEARALRRALRMTIERFAEHLGAAVRTAAQWEARGARITPVPVMQEALDTALERANDDVRTRFALLQLPLGRQAEEAPALGPLVGLERPPVMDDGLVTGHERWFSALAATYRDADPRVLLPPAGAYADQVLALLERSMSPSGRRRLTSVVVGAQQLAGMAAVNAGAPTVARRFLSVARDVADEDGDPTLRAQALGASCYQFSSALRGGSGGNAARTLHVLDQALDLARGDHFTRAWLAVWRADQAVTLGHVEGALSDLDGAQHGLHTQAEPRGFVSPRGCAYNVGSHLEGIRAVAVGLAGEVDEAETTLKGLLASPDVGARQSVVLLCRLATVRANAGSDPEGACEALIDADRAARHAGYRMGTARPRRPRPLRPAMGRTGGRAGPGRAARSRRLALDSPPPPCGSGARS